jgi:hypothetical protein
LAPWRLNYLSFIHNNLPVFKGSLQWITPPPPLKNFVLLKW